MHWLRHHQSLQVSLYEQFSGRNPYSGILHYSPILLMRTVPIKAASWRSTTGYVFRCYCVQANYIQ